MRIAFRFRWIPFVATVLLVTLGISLGQWQDRRAHQKLALQATLAARAAQPALAVGNSALAPEAIEFRHVSLRGQFVADWPVFLDNRPYQGHAGFYLLMPFRLADSDMHVLVARGWLARSLEQRDRIPNFVTPMGTVTITGVVRNGIGHVMQLGTPAPLRPGAIVQNVDALQFAAASRLRLQPFVVEQDDAGAPDTLVRDWPAPALGVEKHQGYAFQWYALAVMAFLFFVMTGFRRGTNRATN